MAVAVIAFFRSMISLYRLRPSHYHCHSGTRTLGMYSPHKRRESERESSTSYFSAFSPRSRNGSTLGIGTDAGSPLTRSSPLSAFDGTSRDPTANQHPLALELQSLRTSLGKFQHVAHKTSMQLQGKAMEVVMAQDEAGRLREENRLLKEELEVLR